MKLKIVLSLLMALAVGGLEAAPKAAVRKSAPRPKAAIRAKAPKRAVRKKAPAASQKPAENAHRRDPYVGAISAVCADGQWKVVFERGAGNSAYPASVTKLMTLLLVLEDVRDNKYTFDTVIGATADVNRCEPSWVGLKEGESMTVRDLCYALMIESANDAAIVLGVNSSGSFGGFVARMNARAKELGMTGTQYYNPNGLPPNAGRRYPWKSFNVSTAADQLKLAQAVVKFPDVFKFTSVKTADLVKTATGYRVSVTRQVNEAKAETTLAPGETLVKQLRNHNNIMVKDKLHIFNPDGKEAVDGLKTGYIDAGGSSLIVTGSREGRRAIVVVLGSATSKIRDAQAGKLMNDALSPASKWP